MEERGKASAAAEEPKESRALQKAKAFVQEHCSDPDDALALREKYLAAVSKIPIEEMEKFMKWQRRFFIEKRLGARLN